MADETKLAGQVYKTLCETIEGMGWKYAGDKERLIVRFVVSGDDIQMNFIIIIDADRQLIRVLSPLPNQMSEAKRMDGAIATCAATYNIADGSFDYDMSDGQIVFRMTASFIDSTIGEGLIRYLISYSCAMVDEYNDRFLALDKGVLSITNFIDNKG